MYWNISDCSCKRAVFRLIETWDVLKWSWVDKLLSEFAINRNMRCIEIWDILETNTSKDRLIETWDVLKWDNTMSRIITTKRLIETWDVLKCKVAKDFLDTNTINRNMRCIEITLMLLKVADYALINRNMRCIEIIP